MSIDIRKHGRWKVLDIFLIGIWVIMASIIPSFRQRYWRRFVTVSIWTNTIYTPDGSPPKPSTMRHEEMHIRQAAQHGKLRQSFRYTFSPRWRIWYEGEAYQAGGTSHQKTVEMLTSGMYFIPPWWPTNHIDALVTAARKSARWSQADPSGIIRYDN